MFLVFIAYYDSLIFSKICSEGGVSPRIIEIALLIKQGHRDQAKLKKRQDDARDITAWTYFQESQVE